LFRYHPMKRKKIQFKMKKKEKIIIFDGICGLCNKSVDILMKLDTQKSFKYTSNQGEFVKTLDIEPDMDSIIYDEDGIIYYKSTAILKILQALGGLWIMTSIFYLIPRALRDLIYDIIAKYRYRIFGKMESCRMPKKEERDLFID